MSVIIYGCGEDAQKFLFAHPYIQVLLCVDEHPEIKEFCGMSVFSPDKLKEHFQSTILIFTHKVLVYKAIAEKLKSYGYQEFDDFMQAHLFQKKIALIWGNCHAEYLKKFLSYSPDFCSQYAFYDCAKLWEMKKEAIDPNIFAHCDLLVCQHITEENSLGKDFSSKKIEGMLRPTCIILKFPNMFGLPKFMFPQTNQENIYVAKRGGIKWYRDRWLDQLQDEWGNNTEQLCDSLFKTDISSIHLDELYNEFLTKMEIRESQCNIHILDYVLENLKKRKCFLDVEHPAKFVLDEIGNRILDYLNFSRMSQHPEFNFVYAHEVPVYPQIKTHFSMDFEENDIKKDNPSEKVENVYMDFREYIYQYIQVYRFEKRGVNKNTIPIFYRAFCFEPGEKGQWTEECSCGEICGRTQKKLRITAIKIRCDEEGSNLKYRIRTVTGWSQYSENGEVCGKESGSDYIQAIQIISDNGDVYGKVHMQTTGWGNWTKASVFLGEDGIPKRMEAFQLLMSRNDKMK